MYGEVCMQFTDSTTEYIASYVNNIPTTEADEIKAKLIDAGAEVEVK